MESFMYKQITLPVRIDDCDYLGHVNNAVYFSYILNATASLFPFSIASELRANRVSVDYQRPAKFGRDVIVEIWFRDSENAVYSIRQDIEILATAKVVWQRSGELDYYLTPLLEHVEPTVKVKEHNYQVEHLGKPFYWVNRVQLRDLTLSGYIDTTSYINRVDEAVWIAIENHGWSFQKMEEENCAVYIVSNDIEIISHPQWLVGKNITVVSQLQNVRKVRGTWRHEFYLTETNELLAREYVTGAFVTLDGGIREPAKGLIDICLLGSSSSSPMKLPVSD
jgi:acyl-CoA thioesterase FadM